MWGHLYVADDETPGIERRRYSAYVGVAGEHREVATHRASRRAQQRRVTVHQFEHW